MLAKISKAAFIALIGLFTVVSAWAAPHISIRGISATPTSWTDTKIVAPVPSALLPGFADVVVTSGGTTSNTASFLVIPVITHDVPASGPVGTSVVITGTSFGDTQADSTITFNDVAASPTSWSNTSITASVPATATTGGIVVTVNGFTTNGAFFDVLPNITSITPASGPVGSLVTISGTTLGQTQGFGGVTFNGVSADVQSWSDSAVSVLVPATATSGNVVLTDHQFLSSNGVGFTVTLPGPTISSLTPTNGPIGTLVTINGTGFGATQGTVSIGGANASITSWSDTQISCAVPDEALSAAVFVTAQGLTSNQATFQISAPAIEGSGFPFGGPGVERTIFGSNFGNIARQVTFNGVSAQVDVWSDTRISVFIPDMQRTGPVIVSAHGEESNPVTFNFVRAIRAVGNTLNLFITPDEATLVVGESHRLRLIDAQGVEQTTGVTWSVDDQQVAQIIV